MRIKKNEFGELVKAYRKQRGWTQEELAERWGYSRVYISQIELGKRKLDSASQVTRLADILDIPQEKLEAIGRGIPQRKIEVMSSKEADSAILQMLLAQSRDKIRLSYLAWLGDQHPAIEEDIHSLAAQLENALTLYRGEFMKPAQQLLAYTHQMRGRIAYDRLDFITSAGHYSEMIELGNELNDADIVTIGMVRQGSIHRKRGRIETALRCFEAAKLYANVASEQVQGVRHLHTATAYADLGNEEGFTRSIHLALDIASNITPNISSLANEFTLDEVLLSQSTGLSELWKPEDALEIYKKTDLLRPFRPLRERGRYLIEKAQAYLFAGDIDTGIKLTLEGLSLVEEYKSRRHIGWVERTYNRLRVLPSGGDKRLNTLRDALVEARRKQASW
ncbi:MAG TPA: helix-turn-helix transcriptional regulator [Ktedonobacteraceae bacterium]|nr:helix-turn-helix transcriptional regulator [Ktedonobacteraceae bacterium]